MKSKIILLFGLVILPLYCFANKKEDALKAQLDSCEKECTRYIILAEEREKRIEELINTLHEGVNVDPKVRELNDSIKNLLSRVDELTQKVNILTQDLVGMDMVKVKYANSRLLTPYDKAKVDDAISVFESINDPKIKNDYGQILTQLKNYPTAINTVKTLIESLQYNGPELTKFNDKELNDWKAKSRSKIDSNQFYQTSKKSDFKILYLFNIIEEAKHRIDNVNSPVKIPDFTDLIIRLDMK